MNVGETDYPYDVRIINDEIEVLFTKNNKNEVDRELIIRGVIDGIDMIKSKCTDKTLLLLGSFDVDLNDNNPTLYLPRISGNEKRFGLTYVSTGDTTLHIYEVVKTSDKFKEYEANREKLRSKPFEEIV